MYAGVPACGMRSSARRLGRKRRLPTNDLTDVLYGRIMSDDKNILPRRYQSHKSTNKEDETAEERITKETSGIKTEDNDEESNIS